MPIWISKFKRAWQAQFLSYKLETLKKWVFLKGVQIILLPFFHIPAGFKFRKNALNSRSRSQRYRFSQWKSRILTKLGPDGLYITQSHHNTEWPPKGTPGGHQGAPNFLLYENWRVETSHLWVSKKIVVWWSEGGPKGLPKGCQKNLDRALFWSTRAHQTFFALIFSMSPRGVRT